MASKTANRGSKFKRNLNPSGYVQTANIVDRRIKRAIRLGLSKAYILDLETKKKKALAWKKTKGKPRD